MIPLWQRTQKFSNAYATLAIDILFSIFWVAALAAVQVWTNGGIPDSTKGYCANFNFGDQDKCVISYGTVIIAVLIFVLWLIAAGVSVYSIIHLRKNGYLPNSRPSISKPQMIEPKFSLTTNGSQDGGQSRPRTRLYQERDLEHGVAHTNTEHGAHPGRKVSWGQSPPMTAPPRMDIHTRPQFRTINYGEPQQLPTETTALSPQIDGPTTRRYALPPRLQLWGPDTRSPALVMDYGAGLPTAGLTPGLTPSGHAPYDVRRTVMQPLPTAYGTMGAVSTGYAGYDSRRSVLRTPLPGPASMHNGGYNSAYHTPLPTGMAATGNSWRDDMAQAAANQQAIFPAGQYFR